MDNNKNVVEDALFQIKNLEETLKENAKGILQSTMSEEIKQLVKESLKEAKDEEEIDEQDEPMAGEEELDTETEVEDEDMDDEMEMGVDMDDEEMDMDDEEEMDMDDEEMDMEDEETIDLTNASDDEVLRVFKAMGDEDGIVVKKEGGNVHFTDGDNEYMIQLGESEMEDELYEMEDEMDFDDLEIDEMEMEDEMEETIYEIEMEDEDDEEMDMEFELDEDADMDMDELDEDADMDMDEMDEEEEMEVDMEAVMEAVKKAIKPKGVGIGHGPKFNYDKKPNMGGGFDEKKKEAFGKGTKAMGTGKAKFEYKEEKNWGSNKGEYKRKKVDGVEKKAGNVKGHYKTYEKEETKEAARTLGNGSKDGSRGLRKARLNNRNMEFNPFKLSESSINEVNLLREKNEEYKKALDVFRTKLNEVAVFNSNLAYATRLFTEHSTTKQEKISILKRFDNVESLKESKNLYRTIKDELSSSTGSNGEQKLTESIERTVNKTVSTGSSANLIESKTYENPQFLRMKDLMSKLK